MSVLIVVKIEVKEDNEPVHFEIGSNTYVDEDSNQIETDVANKLQEALQVSTDTSVPDILDQHGIDFKASVAFEGATAGIVNDGFMAEVHARITGEGDAKDD